jgi:hypothetical protein
MVGKLCNKSKDNRKRRLRAARRLSTSDKYMYQYTSRLGELDV